MIRDSKLRAALVLLASAGLVAAAPAWATPETIAYFNGPQGFGFDNAALPSPLVPVYTIPSVDYWQPAGSRRLNDGSFQIELRQRQKVREKDGFFRVRVKLDLRNKTGRTLDQAALIFPALGGPPDFPDYAGVPIDLKLGSGKNPLDIISYADGDETFFFAGFLLEDFAPGKRGRVVRKFKYDVLANRLVEGEAPAFGVAAVIAPLVVPEASAAWLLLAALCAARWQIRKP